MIGIVPRPHVRIRYPNAEQPRYAQRTRHGANPVGSALGTPLPEILNRGWSFLVHLHGSPDPVVNPVTIGVSLATNN